MFTRVPYGGGAACGTVMQAAMAVATGVADVVVCYRAFNERSGMRFGGPGMGQATLPPWLDWYGPFGLLSPAGWVSLHARRYMLEYGVTNEHLGRISVVDRKHAANNPAAVIRNIPNYDSFTRHTFDLRAIYGLTRNIEVTVGAAYEKYKYDDAQLANYNYTILTGTSQNFLSGAYAFQDYDAVLGYLTLKYLFR